MIPASTAFHEAVRSGAKQRTLLHFYESDHWFTHGEIGLTNCKYHSYFSSEEDLTFGLTPSLSIDFQLFNDNGELDNFEFGWFTAYRGVQLSTESYSETGPTVEFGGVRITAYSTAPYLRVSGEAYMIQPTYQIKAFAAIDNALYCFGTNNRVFIIEIDPTTYEDMAEHGFTWTSQLEYTWLDYTGLQTSRSETVTDPVIQKLISRMIASGESYMVRHRTEENSIGLITYIYRNGIKTVYEYIPKGNFYADRPERVYTKVVSVSAYDAMYEVLDTQIEGLELTYPLTIQELLNAICTKTGVVCKAPLPRNGYKVIQEADLTETLPVLTYRELIGRIAEASGTNAVFDYDGRLVFKWFEDTGHRINETNYENCIPAEYKVHKVSRFQIRNADNLVSAIVGSGTNDYVIQNNKLLEFDTEADGNAYASVLYNVLKSSGDYIPVILNNWFKDPAVQAGDLIQVKWKNRLYEMPIFNIEESWTGLTLATAESTGNPYREPLDMTDRAMYELDRRLNTIDDTVSHMTTSDVFIAAVQALTTSILGAEGGAVRFLDTNDDGIQDTLYIADNINPERAVKVWRFNYLGWGASTHGYNGPFELGATLEHGIVANFITTGILNAGLVKTGVLSDVNGVNYWNMNTGELHLSASTKMGEDSFAYIISNLQDQIDGQIMTWFYNYTPSTSNAPASTWTTAAEKNRHLGDLFYDTSTGYCYRWMYSNTVYSWQRISDTDITTALSMASRAQDTADGKRRVFVSQPIPPYDLGDLWAQGSTGDLLRCNTAKAEGEVYASTDWVRASKYTDDTLASQVQLDLETFETETEKNLVTASYSGRNFAIGTYEPIVITDGTASPGNEYRLSSNTLVASDAGKTTLRVSFRMKRTGVRVETGVPYLGMFIQAAGTVDGSSTSQGLGRIYYGPVTEDDTDFTTYGFTVPLTLYFDTVSAITKLTLSRYENVAGTIEIKNVKVEVTSAYTPWCLALEDHDSITTEYNTKFEVLETGINANTTAISRAESAVAINKTNIQVIAEGLATKVSQTTYTADMADKADVAWVSSTVESLQSQTASEILNIFRQSTTYTDQALTDYEQLKNDVYSWQKFSADGLEIGKSNSPFKTVLSNSKLSFLENNTEVAYISNNTMYITNAQISRNLRIGGFDFDATDTGLVIKWNG